MAGLWAAEARLRLGTGAAVAAAVQARCLVEFEDCDGLGSILGGARDDKITLQLEMVAAFPPKCVVIIGEPNLRELIRVLCHCAKCS